VAHPAGLAQPKIAGLVEDRAKLRLPAAPAEAACVALGPEGGFTEEEVRLARASRLGWALDLGPRILRVETAALSLAAWASQSLWAGV